MIFLLQYDKAKTNCKYGKRKVKMSFRYKNGIKIVFFTLFNKRFLKFLKEFEYFCTMFP